MIHNDCVLCLTNNALVDQEVVSELPCTATISSSQATLKAVCNTGCLRPQHHWQQVKVPEQQTHQPEVDVLKVLCTIS